MSASSHKKIRLPSGRNIRKAIQLYLRYAYSSAPPPHLARFMPPDGFQAEEWLMQPFIEHDPPDAPVESVRSFALRLGNEKYPHMKMRLSRPPRDEVFLFSVDCHDTFLSAPVGSQDYDILEELKRHNAIVAEAIRLAWEEAKLPTERGYLRGKIQQAKNVPAGPPPQVPSQQRGGHRALDSGAP